MTNERDDDERTMLRFAIEVRDGETEDEAIARTRREAEAKVRELDPGAEAGVPYVVTKEELTAQGYIVFWSRRRFPIVGRRRPRWWPRTWR
ncbi:MAG: hypothetical protein M3R49_08620 [Chloroflexota bacterium]|nr:hypothetical protein [Chloroflexota bacterium]